MYNDWNSVFINRIHCDTCAAPEFKNSTLDQFVMSGCYSDRYYRNDDLNCQECIKASTQINPVYAMDCIKCCARLVVSARPMKARQEAMLAHIVKHGNVSRAQVLEHIQNSRIM